MGKKQKGGILRFLMLMNAMKGGGIKKRKKTKSQKQKGGLFGKFLVKYGIGKKTKRRFRYSQSFQIQKWKRTLKQIVKFF